MSSQMIATTFVLSPTGDNEFPWDSPCRPPGVDSIDIPGATGTSYTTTADDITGLISVIEIPDGDRSRAVRSNAISFSTESGVRHDR
jgi:hypothetical protein